MAEYGNNKEHRGRCANVGAPCDRSIRQRRGSSHDVVAAGKPLTSAPDVLKPYQGSSRYSQPVVR